MRKLDYIFIIKKKLISGRGAAMIVESLNIFYHLSCFRCYVCSIALGNGTRGADVRVRGSKLHCQKCFSTEEKDIRSSQI